jgi:hypothetical protein
MGQFHKALQDAVKAKDLNPEWPKVKLEQIFTIFNSMYLGFRR